MFVVLHDDEEQLNISDVCFWQAPTISIGIEEKVIVDFLSFDAVHHSFLADRRHPRKIFKRLMPFAKCTIEA